MQSADGKHVVMLGDKPISETLAQWAASDAGAPFRAASVNTGGGAAGGKPGSAGAGKRWAEMSTEDRTALYRTDPAAYASAKAAG